MTHEKQLLKKYEAERVGLVRSQAQTTARLSALEAVIASLRIVLGEAPAPARKASYTATGTKALIMDALADGRWYATTDLARTCKVTGSAIRLHLKQLTKAGDIERQGTTSGTRYRIP